MVYDSTDDAPFPRKRTGEPGYAVFSEDLERLGISYTVFTDDGRGTGEYVCQTTERWYAFRIARLLDRDDNQPWEDR